MRERRPGVWEIRIVVGHDPATGRSKQRSFTFRGDEDAAHQRRDELLERFGVRRAVPAEDGERLTVADLLDRFITAPHLWSPTTLPSHASVVGFLRQDRIGRLLLGKLDPARLEAAIVRWKTAGATVSVVSGRFRVLHAAISWAITQRLLRYDPLAGMHAPPRPLPCKHLPSDRGRQLIHHADQLVEKSAVQAAEQPGSRARQMRLFRAEQSALLVRLAADTGLRRGELAALKITDLDGRVLTVERGSKGKTIGPTKTHRQRRLTLGATVAALWHTHVRNWTGWRGQTQPGPWLFSRNPTRTKPLTPRGLAGRFTKLRETSGVHEATLHRFRHTVGTHLVSQGKILKAQARLGHDNPATTLRTYAHAQPLDDQDTANDLDTLYNPSPYNPDP